MTYLSIGTEVKTKFLYLSHELEEWDKCSFLFHFNSKRCSVFIKMFVVQGFLKSNPHQSPFSFQHVFKKARNSKTLLDKYPKLHISFWTKALSAVMINVGNFIFPDFLHASREWSASVGRPTRWCLSLLSSADFCFHVSCKVWLKKY